MARKFIKAGAVLLALGLSATALAGCTAGGFGERGPNRDHDARARRQAHQRAPRGDAREAQRASHRKGERDPRPVLRRVGRLADPVQPPAALGRRQRRPHHHGNGLAVRVGERREGRLPSSLGGDAEEHAPKTWAQVDADGHWDLTKLDDGQIYFIPEDNFTQYTNHGFFYRGDWAAEAGFPDGEITKFEDFTKYFQWVKDNKPEAYPWDVAGDSESALIGYMQGHTDMQTIQQVSAGNYYPFQTTEADPNTVTSWYMEGDALLEAAELAKEWNEIGVWREDALNYDGDTRELLYAGPSGTDQHHTQTFIGQYLRQPDEEAARLRPEVLLLGSGERERLQGHPDARRHGGECQLRSTRRRHSRSTTCPQRRGELQAHQLRHRGHRLRRHGRRQARLPRGLRLVDRFARLELLGWTHGRVRADEGHRRTQQGGDLRRAQRSRRGLPVLDPPHQQGRDRPDARGDGGRALRSTSRSCSTASSTTRPRPSRKCARR